MKYSPCPEQLLVRPSRRCFAKHQWLTVALLLALPAGSAAALNGGTRKVTPRNGWWGFEIITQGNNPVDAFAWAMPGTFDGLGAQTIGGDTLRVQINHESSDATISQVDLNLANFRKVLYSTQLGNNGSAGSVGGISFVTSAQQAYDSWSANGGVSFTATSSNTNTTFSRFCSGQSYNANTFGLGRGFVDNLYITGEEIFNGSGDGSGRLFALDLAERDLYQLSGVTGSGGGGVGGIPFDAWENAALIDTGETSHVALVLSPDNGTKAVAMKIYIGHKGLDANGNASNDFLARNGLAYGSYYYLTRDVNGNDLDQLALNQTIAAGFDTTLADSFDSTKLEDVDTFPGDPTRMVLGDQTDGLFTFDFNLDFTGGAFNSASSTFSVTKIQNHINDVNNAFGDADNVEWTAPTSLNGTAFAEGLIFVNEDTDTGSGEIWMLRPDGSGLIKIADTDNPDGSPNATATESSGILDISSLVGYRPGSVLLTTNQGSGSSLTALINPNAALDLGLILLGDYDADLDVDQDDLDAILQRFGQSTILAQPGDWDADGHIGIGDVNLVLRNWTTPVPPVIDIPEPGSAAVLAALAGICACRRRSHS